MLVEKNDVGWLILVELALAQQTRSIVQNTPFLVGEVAILLLVKHA